MPIPLVSVACWVLDFQRHMWFLYVVPMTRNKKNTPLQNNSFNLQIVLSLFFSLSLFLHLSIILFEPRFYFLYKKTYTSNMHMFCLLMFILRVKIRVRPGGECVASICVNYNSNYILHKTITCLRSRGQ